MNTNERYYAANNNIFQAFISLLFLSGLIAIPVDQILSSLLKQIYFPSPFMRGLFRLVNALTASKARFSYLSYGYGFDWLAVSHILLAFLFIVIIQNPLKNTRLLMIGWVGWLVIITTSLVEGLIKGIPFWWQFINYLFGIVGLLVLWSVYHKTKGSYQ
jgi:hypothetical protein